MTLDDARADALVLTAASAAFAAAADGFPAAISPKSLDAQKADFDPGQALTLQFGLGHFCASLGITPSAVFGIGVGEIVAATLAGLLTPSDAVERARAWPTAPPTPASGACTLCPPAQAESRPSGPSKWGLGVNPVGWPRPGRWLRRLACVLCWQWATKSALRRRYLNGRLQCWVPRPIPLGAVSLRLCKSLYLVGVDIDWKAFYRPKQKWHQCSELELPTYAFQRQRFWRPGGRAPSGQFPAQVAVDWPKLMSTVAAQSETGPLGWDPSAYCDPLAPIR